MKKLVLIDGNSLLNRAFFATPLFTTKDGEPTNGIFGFIKLFLKILGSLKPEYAVVAFDMHAPTFRHKMYDKYKATRKGMPPELACQMPVLKECLSLMNVKMCYMEGVEADDIIGTLSRKFDGVECYIYTGDRDAYQLVKENVNVCFTRKGVSDILELTNENFFREVGMRPCQVVEIKSLMGDSSDNIPGIPGIGEKTAKTLLQRYGSLDNIYAHIDDFTGSLRRKLKEGKEMGYLSHDLATIDTNVELDIDLEDCRVIRPFPAKLRQKFVSLEFRIFFSDESLYEKESEEEVAEVVADSVEKVAVATFADFLPACSANRFSIVWERDRKCVFADAKEYQLSLSLDLLSPSVSEEDEEKILEAVFADEKNTVVCYRAKDMLHVLKDRGIRAAAKLEDVSILRYLANYSVKEEPLDYVLTSYDLPPAFPAYSVSVLFDRLYPKVCKDGMEELYLSMERPLLDVLFDMEETGVCVEEEYLRKLGNDYAERLEKVAKRIHILAGDDDFNINSSKQLSDILFGKLGLPAEKKSKRGAYSSGADILEKLAPEHEIVREILEYRKIQKLLSTYVTGLKPFIKDGKVHTTYTQVVTATGRLSSKNPNLQNIPIRTEEGKEIRKIFKASQGNVLVDADYSQIELRIMAHMSDCKELIDAFRAGKDVHRDTAAKVYGVTEEEVTDTMRRRAKAVNFGIIYGESAFGLSRSLDIPPKEAAEFIEKYFAAYPAVRQYQTDTVEFAKENGYVETLFCRRREIPELKSPNYNLRQFGERAAMNMPLQGTSADIIKKAMISVHDELKMRGMRSKLILQVHDELVLDAPESEAEEAAEILKKCMENVVELKVPLTVEVAFGKNWYEAK